LLGARRGKRGHDEQQHRAKRHRLNSARGGRSAGPCDPVDIEKFERKNAVPPPSRTHLCARLYKIKTLVERHEGSMLEPLPRWMLTVDAARYCTTTCPDMPAPWIAQ